MLAQVLTMRILHNFVFGLPCDTDILRGFEYRIYCVVLYNRIPSKILVRHSIFFSFLLNDDGFEVQ